MISKVVKIAVALVTLFAIASFAGNSGAGGKNFAFSSSSGQGPGNIFTVTLFPTTVSLGSDTTQDSLGNGKQATFGPFPLAISHSRPAFKTMQLHYAQGTMAAADTIRIDYQILPTMSIADSSATWTALSRSSRRATLSRDTRLSWASTTLRPSPPHLR